MARFDLSDAEWRIIQPLLPNKPRGVARVDDRTVLNGIFYILRTGSPWRDLPGRYGPPTTIYNRFNRWAKAGDMSLNASSFSPENTMAGVENGAASSTVSINPSCVVGK